MSPYESQTTKTTAAHSARYLHLLDLASRGSIHVSSPLVICAVIQILAGSEGERRDVIICFHNIKSDDQTYPSS